MNLLFCHDGPMAIDKEYNAYPLNFTEEVLSRYYAIADIITFATRTKLIDPSKTMLQKANMEKLKIVDVPNLSSIKGILINRKKAKMILDNQIKKCDYLIVRLPSLIGYIAIKIAKKNGKPYLIEVVGCTWDALWNHSLKGKLIALPSYLTMKKAVKNAPYALYVSNKFLQQRYPCNGKTIGCSDVLLPSLVDESVLKKRISKINQMSKDKSIVLGTIAAVNVRYKGQQYVIKAISKLNKEGYNFEYHLVGGGDKSYLKSIAEKYNVADKVKFLGTLPHEKIFDYLDNIDIYIQPSKQEGLPRALIEAMSRGCPSLGSKVGGIPELLNSDCVFHKGSVHEICELLKTLDTKRMLKEAKRNFEKAKEYNNELLEKRRMLFFSDFSRNVSLARK